MEGIYGPEKLDVKNITLTVFLIFFAFMNNRLVYLEKTLFKN